MTERPRADAQHNRRAILAAAREAVRDGGEAGLDRIAKSAGVSARTLYRHFPTRDELLAAVLEDYFAEQVEPLRRRVAAESDPRVALETVLASGVTVFLDHPGILAAANGNALAAEVAGRHLEPFGEVLARAQRSGAVRADLVLEDLPCLITMLVAGAGAQWRRYLALLLDSLSPAAVSAPLPALR
ncbi:TetR/AcrR family transcriptional regulator [Amycolatopsis jiangsuensis]|uniref:AcrR family transcriptional regulator n=1 Tax=Amycolatopsis jiangsuensis TaxID=1181879 RepID=A0A840J474_9PSEU|nr:TetR/AcrR family transcriptional regulator [Amycolatopsis jiangsuensis]MBB4688425.1 AcrR family transcriptional regulator [Amycolatopsis jiangsuensis]